MRAARWRPSQTDCSAGRFFLRGPESLRPLIFTSTCSSSTPSNSDTLSSSSRRVSSSPSIPASSVSTSPLWMSGYVAPSTRTPSGSCFAPTRTTPLLGTPSQVVRLRSPSPATISYRPPKKPHCPRRTSSPGLSRDPGVEPHWNGQSRLGACWARVGVIGRSDGGRFRLWRGSRFIRCRWSF